MQVAAPVTNHSRYVKCIEASKRVRWDIDKDVIRGRTFDFTRKFLPDALARIGTFNLDSADERRFLSQIQGRTYANMFGLVERFIGAKILEVTRGHALGDQVVVESLVRFSDEELKHQELFRRLESMMALEMPKGYAFLPQPNDVANAVLGKCTWAVLGLTCHIELFSVDHYRQSIDADSEDSALWKDVFLFHMKEESQHAVLDEMEWQREDAKLTARERDAAVDQLIELVGAVDGLLQIQSTADADYFKTVVPRKLDAAEARRLREAMLAAYRWQYIVSGVRSGRFMQILGGLVNEAQMTRIGTALAPLMQEAVAA
jgi:hypothetical protein